MKGQKSKLVNKVRLNAYKFMFWLT